MLFNLTCLVDGQGTEALDRGGARGRGQDEQVVSAL